MSHRNDDELDARVGEASAVRGLFDETPFMLIGFTGPRHRIVAANAAYHATVDRTRLVGLEVAEAFPETVGRHLIPMMDRVYATGEPHTAPEWRSRLAGTDGGGPVRDVYSSFTFFPRRSADGTVIGVGFYGFDVTESVQARRAAEQKAAEAERRAEQARDVVIALQRELLPNGVPVLPGLRVAGSYLSADADTAAGGDWFDALPLPDGRVALVVGDVVGHGVTASAVMGQLSVLLQDRLTETGDVATALAAVDRMAVRLPGARVATVCVAVLDPVSGELTYSTAGHPPPLVLPATGEPRYLPPSGAGPFAVGSAFPVGTARLEAGDQLLLYSDGILERPGRPLAESTVELAQVAGDVAAGRALHDEVSSPVERMCTQTLELLVRATGHTDDITLLAAQRVPATPDLALAVQADLDALARVRTALRRWLDGLGACGPDVLALQQVVGELVTNAVEHAYGGVPSATLPKVLVTATLTAGGEVHAEVADSGRWRDPTRTPGRGRGLWLATEMVDTLVVDHRAGGTTVRLRHRLSRPAWLLTDPAVLPGVVAPPPRDGADLVILSETAGDQPRIRLNGPVDASTGGRLHRELLRATVSGTRALTVDLTGVTLLASAGVAVLHTATERSRSHGVGLRLHAPAGSPAQQVLALVALPHATADDGQR